MAEIDDDGAVNTARHNDPEAAVRVAVLGCGNVGGALVALLLEDSDAIAARSGVRLELAGVAVGDPSRARPGVPASLITGDAKGLVNDPDVDVVVELIGGVDPARSLVEAALAAGKSVVTANKALLAAHGSTLAETASAAGLDLLYEAAVAGAIPLIRPLRESLAGERIRRVMGIVNGTTNYILTMMSEEGVSYAHALAEAQRLGYAERDPSADVDGHDAASKAAILASLAFRCDVVADDVPPRGHRHGRPRGHLVRGPVGLRGEAPGRHRAHRRIRSVAGDLGPGASRHVAPDPSARGGARCVQRRVHRGRQCRRAHALRPGGGREADGIGRAR